MNQALICGETCFALICYDLRDRMDVTEIYFQPFVCLGIEGKRVFVVVGLLLLLLLLTIIALFEAQLGEANLPKPYFSRFNLRGKSFLFAIAKTVGRMYLVNTSPDVIFCDWLDSKHQPTNYLVNNAT